MKKSIKETLEKIIRENDFLEDGLYHGYVNLTSLASYLLPTVQKLSGKPTTIGSLTMTLSRIAAELEKQTYIRIRPENIRVRTGISYATFTKAPGLAAMLNNFSEDIENQSAKSSQLFSQLEGNSEITVLYTSLFKPVINEIAGHFPPAVLFDDLVQIIVHIPPEQLEQKGMIYYVVKQLNYFDVNIIELYTTQTDLSILIKKDDLKNAMNILA